MRVAPYHRRFLALALAGSLFCAYYRPAPGPDGPAGLPEAGPPPLWTELSPGVPEVVILRLVAKAQLARAVADGRRPLREAAALVRALDRLPPQPARLPRFACPHTIPEDNEDGWLCWQVVQCVRAALFQEPEQAAAVVAGLEADLAEELRSRGFIRLPDPSTLEPVSELLERARGALAEVQRNARRVPGRADN